MNRYEWDTCPALQMRVAHKSPFRRGTYVQHNKNDLFWEFKYCMHSCWNCPIHGSYQTIRVDTEAGRYESVGVFKGSRNRRNRAIRAETSESHVFGDSCFTNYDGSWRRVLRDPSLLRRWSLPVFFFFLKKCYLLGLRVTKEFGPTC